MKKPRVARTRAGGRWTEAEYFQFLRDALRKLSRFWPPISKDALNAAKRPYIGPVRQQKWEYRCAHCGDWFGRKGVSVDHIEPVGSLRCDADLEGFVTRLFCEPSNLQVLCKLCHDKKTAFENSRRRR